MFYSISWTQFALSVCIIVSIYYIVTVCWYYRYDIVEFFQPQLAAGIGKQIIASNDLPAAVQSFTDEMQAYLEEAGKKALTKETILYSLQRILSKYPVIISSAYAASLQELLISECETLCTVRLSGEEASKLWQG